jgi:hypothetical protein
MTQKKRLLIAASLTAVLTVVFFLMLSARFFHRHPVNWVTAEAPAKAVVGRPFEVRAQLKDIPQAGSLLADLHRVTREGHSQGRMSSGGSFPAVSGGTYRFTMRVKPEEGLEYVGVVIFLTPTGRWADRILAVSSEPIPVKPEEPGAKPAPTKKLRLFWSGYRPVSGPGPDSEDRSRVGPEPGEQAKGREAQPAPQSRPRPESRDNAVRTPRRTQTPVRIVLFALLFAGGLLSLRLSRQRDDGKPGEVARVKRPWAAFGIVLLLASIVELFLLDETITEWGRGMALQSNLYFVRRPFQMLLISVIAALGVSYFLYSVFTAFRRRSISHARLAGLGIIFYLAVSLVEMLSFHYVDKWKDRLVLGVSVIDLLKGVFAGAVLVIVILALAAPRSRRAA